MYPLHFRRWCFFSPPPPPPSTYAVCARFEVAHGRAATVEDAPALTAALEELCKAEGLVGAAPGDLGLGAYLEQGTEMPAINAIVGGVVANDVIKAVACKGEPIVNNLFMYSLQDGAGWVERLGGEA